MNPKNIDRLFQEELKNLEATPNKNVWNNIESKLTKKKRSVLPIWWFSGGAAAVLILGLVLFPFSKDSDTHKNNSIITKTPENKTEINKHFIDNIDSLLLNKNKKQDILVAEKKIEIELPKDNQSIKNDTTKDEIIVAETNTKKTAKKKKLSPSKNAIKKMFLATNASNKNISSSNIAIEINENKLSKEANTLKENPSSKNTDANKLIAEKEYLKKKMQQDSIRKKSIFEENLKPKKDFLTAIKTAKEIKKEEKKKVKNVWSLSPVVAILNSNSFSDTSPLNRNLSSSTTGKNNFSYGLQVGYKINNKWAVKSGIHQQKMSYQNNNIVVTDATASNTSSAVFDRKNTFNFSNNNAEAFRTSSDISLTNKVSSNGNLTQEYGYIEIPLEIQYNLSNHKKFDSQLVAGFSSLFLNTNTIDLTTNNFNQTGVANNLNTVNFSGNLGLDFGYNFDKNWSVNLNPMFKAQLNTFNKNSNGFSPFNMGVYTGIKYTF